MEPEALNDVDLVRKIPAVPSILDVIAKVTGMGFVTVARVTEHPWIACEVLDAIDFGLRPGGELRVETTLCREVRHASEAIIIDNVADDPVYCGHPTPAMYGFKSYISMPIILPDSSFFGTLCAIDPKPTRLKGSEMVEMFRLFAELIAVHVDARKKIATTENALLDAHATSELREQFIAVLGHDLRNPLSAFASGTELLRRKPQDEQSKIVLNAMTASAKRMTALVENVADFARGRLGGGLSLTTESKSGVHHVVGVVFDANIDLDMNVLAVGGSIAAYATNDPRPAMPFWDLLFKNARLLLLGSDDFPAAAKLDATTAVTDLVASGWRGLAIDKSFALSHIADAHSYAERKHVPGRVVLTV